VDDPGSEIETALHPPGVSAELPPGRLC
jgi:hypothetical protein